MLTIVSSGSPIIHFGGGCNTGFSPLRHLKSSRLAILFNPWGEVNNAVRNAPAGAQATAQNKSCAHAAVRVIGFMEGYDE